MKRADLLRAVGREPLFSTGLLLSPGAGLQDVRKQLSRWTADGAVVQVRRGLYALGEPYRTAEPHPYEVSNALVHGSYVSLETVLADHGLIPEAVFATTAVTTGRPGARATPFGTFVYQHLKADLFWGYRTQTVGGSRIAFVAVPEKALLDLSYLRGRSGEPAFARALRLQRLDSLDLERLATMAERFSSRKVERFAGNVSSLARIEAGVSGPVKEYLREIVARSAPRDAVNILREYLQARILESLQDSGAWASLAFMGGTSLRFLYRAPRFSEELDFALETPSPEFDFLRLIASARARFEKERYRTEAKASTGAVVHKASIRFPGLEHELGLSHRAEKALSVKVEVDTRPPAGAGLEVTTVRRHATLRLAHHDKSSLLAGKVAALLRRDWIKGRDVYDLVWYLSDPTWPEPNEVLLANALRPSGPASLAAEVEGWKSALVRRLGAASWDGVKVDVERFLERPTEVWMAERETVLSIMAQRGWKE